tara:strand:- start:29 stop:418 length:390 start_codon:yes stop_codon:yes gene_type:complete
MKQIFLLFISFIALSAATSAQTKITFNINLKPMLLDSTFIPGQEFLEVKGDLRPFTRTTNFQMTDETPIDSVYSVTLEFPSRYNGQILTYNYVIKSLVNKDRNEFLPRTLDLKGKEIIDPPYYFDSFPN